MEEDSRSKVTITLGRSHQVVKKAGPAWDSTVGDSESTVGRKRSVRDRLGGNIDLSTNKRLQGDGRELSLSASNVVDDMGLNEDDLRFKIMQRNMHKKIQSDSQQSGLDLRDMLSRPAQSSTTTVGARRHISERKDARQQFLEPRDGRQYMSELRDPRHRAEVRDSRQQTAEVRDGRQYMSQMRDPRLHMTEVRDSRQHIADIRDSRRHIADVRDSRQHIAGVRDTRQHIDGVRDTRQHVAGVRDTRQHIAGVRDSRQHMAESRDRRQHIAEVRDGRRHIAEVRDGREHMAEVRHSGQHMPDRKDIRRHMPEPYSLSITGRIPSTPIAGSLTHSDTTKNSYSPWTLEHLRRRSPDGVVSSSRGFSPPRREEEFQRRPSVRSYDDMRVGSYMSKDVIEYSRPLASASYTTTAALPAGPSKLMAPPLAPSMPPSSLLQKSSYTVDVQHTVDSFLYSLGLEKFAINFKAEEVDMYALKQMGDGDLKDLGVPMGPRKKILLALQSRAKRPI